MRFATRFGDSSSPCIRGLLVCLISVLIVLTGYRRVEAATIVVDAGCNILDAINSANRDSAVASCEAGSGPDTIVMNGSANVFGVATNNFGGENNALPPITSTITISGNGAGIVRNPTFGCPTADPDLTFRLFYIASSGNLTLNRVTLRNGCAEQGGAIYNFGSLTLVNVDVISNTTLLAGGGVMSPAGPVTVSQSEFFSNTAAESGGALYFSEGRVERSFFHQNSAGEGGAFFLVGPDDKYFLNNRIIGNSAGSESAALYLQTGVARIDNNLFAENKSSSEVPADIGLGVVNGPSTLTGSHNTMVSVPGAPGGAIAAGLDGPGDTIFLSDTIISGYRYGVSGLSNAQIKLNGVLWDNVVSPITTLNTAQITVDNAYTGTSAFVNAAGHNYHLSRNSQAINRAVSDLPATDIDGNLRPVGAFSDIGFDEFVPAIGIQVVKRVGTNATGCANTSSLTVNQNSAVFYCITLRNTSDVTFTHHTVSDAMLGINTTLTFNLAPSATVQITRSLISALGPVTVTHSFTNTVVVTSTNITPSSPGTTPGSVEQFTATAVGTGIAAVTTRAPTALPPAEQPEERDNRIYLPVLDQ